MSTHLSNIKEAYLAARGVRVNAHAPYSEFQVGVALKLRDRKELILGCNVENASYGITICAERNAFFHAIALYRVIDPEYIVIVTDSNPPAPPCGLCLQAMAEFCQPTFEIYLANLKGIQEKLMLKDFLPKPFHLNFWSVKK
jgi:cytidine deaminase